MAYTTIDDPSEYFNSLIYTGNATVRALTFDGNSDLDVDWIWLKSRSASGNHHVYDTVRGTQKHLRTNLANAEGTNGGTDGVTAFSSNGVTIGTNTASNEDNTTFVGWGWKAGTSFTNDASATSVGTIDSAGSVNTDAGFSIITYTGNLTANATVGHGLGVAPSMIIIKNRTDSADWFVFHQSLTSNNSVKLNTNDAEFGGAYIFDSTSSTFKLRDHNVVNGNGDNLIAYCFAEKKGYSKFGSHTGNGSGTDGTFVYTGFLPSFIMFKSTSTTGSWEIHDNKRDAFNPSSKRLFPHLSNAEATEDYVDFVSNGFKFRTSDATGNTNGTSYIYMAFAESPLVTSTGVPTTAR